jgi:hypothetical protein
VIPSSAMSPGDSPADGLFQSRRVQPAASGRQVRCGSRQSIPPKL